MSKIKAKVKIQLECIALVTLDENDVNGDLTVDEVIDIGAINNVGDFDVIDYI